MPDIHIHRDHQLGLAKARKIAFRWAEQAEAEFGMECVYEEGADGDCVRFSRSGVSGELAVTATSFELDAKLGFLLGAFKDRIETEIVKNLDALLGAGKATGARAAAPKPASPSAGKPAGKSVGKSAAGKR